MNRFHRYTETFSSGRINITATVYNVAMSMGGSFHVENIAFAMEVEGFNIVEKMSANKVESVIGKMNVGRDQIARALDSLSRQSTAITKQGKGWYAVRR